MDERTNRRLTNASVRDSRFQLRDAALGQMDMQRTLAGFARRLGRSGINADGGLQNRRAVERQERRLGHALRHVSPGIEGTDDAFRYNLLRLDERVVARNRPPILAALLRRSFERRHEWICVRNHLAL